MTGRERLAVKALFFFLSLLLTVPHAQASCSNPAGESGTLFMNADYMMLQYCDGTVWRGVGDAQLGSAYCTPDFNTWTARDSTRQWSAVASSADGTKLVAGAGGYSGGNPTYGRLYTSTDSGVSWTQRENDRSWRDVASSADGMKLVAAALADQIFTSTDGGVNWTARESSRDWFGVASSSDGTKLAAVVNGGQIYTSTDSGVNWTARESTRWWFRVASSADGTKLVAIVSGGQIYTSTDSGVNWTARESNRNWTDIASSSDGTKLVALVNGGQIYTSTDSGVNWTARESSRDWGHVASSSDGMNLGATVGMNSAAGRIYTSDDGGINWTEGPSPNRWWNGLASSAQGNKLVAAVNGGQIYTNDCTGGMGDGLCVSPAMPQGALYYNEDGAVLLYCNGSDWVALGAPAGVVTTGLLHYWTFDEPSGTTAADSVGSSDATLNLDAAFSPSGGTVGGAVTLDGTQDNVSVDDTADFPTGDFTWTAWIKPDDLTSRVLFSGRTAANSRSFAQWTSATDMEIVFNELDVFNGTSGFLANSTWQHFALTRTGSTVTVYRNGSSLGTASNGTSLDISAGTCKFNIGSWPSNCTAANTSYTFDGMIDEVRIYDRGISASEVDELYQCGLAGDCGGGSGGSYCASPTAAAGSIFYNANAKRHQYCNGDEWIGFILANDGTGGVGSPPPPPVIEGFQPATPVTGADSITLTAPAGITAGELLLIIVGDDDVGAGPEFSNNVSGWNFLATAGNATADAHIAVYWKEATGSEGNVVVNPASTGDDIFGWYIRISGADTADPFDVSNFAQSSADADPHTVPQVTTTVVNTLAIFGLSFDGGDGDPFTISGTGWAEEGELAAGTGTDNAGGVWGSKDMPTAGATGDVSVDMTGASGVDGAAYFQLAIKPQ